MSCPMTPAKCLIQTDRRGKAVSGGRTKRIEQFVGLWYPVIGTKKELDVFPVPVNFIMAVPPVFGETVGSGDR